MKSEGILSPGSCFWFLSFASVATALPTNQSIDAYGPKFPKTSKSSSPDLSAVCVHNEVVYARGENFTTDNPCETCVCSPPGIRCLVRTCEPRPGCKSIHVASRCCPESVCECEINGRIYSNGEKVEGREPCKVCYCKGGEIKCALITCYSRDDCEAVYVDGRCCPKYDDCPPLETMKNKSASSEPTPVVISDLSSEADETTKTEESRKLETTVAAEAARPVPSVPTLEIEEITGSALFEISRVEGFGDPEETAATAASESKNSTGNVGSESSKGSQREIYDPPHHPDAKMGEKFNVPLNANSLAKEFQSVVQDWLAERGNATESAPDNITAETWHEEVEATASPDLNNETSGQADAEIYAETSSGEGLKAFENSTLPEETSENLRQSLHQVAESQTSDLSSANPEEAETETSPSGPVSEESSAPGLKMLSAEQIQFLQVGEEFPAHVDAARPEVVVVVPSATPITVKMTKVSDTNSSAKPRN